MGSSQAQFLTQKFYKQHARVDAPLNKLAVHGQ
jgi:hypothetical protein